MLKLTLTITLTLANFLAPVSGKGIKGAFFDCANESQDQQSQDQPHICRMYIMTNNDTTVGSSPTDTKWKAKCSGPKFQDLIDNCEIWPDYVQVNGTTVLDRKYTPECWTKQCNVGPACLSS